MFTALPSRSSDKIILHESVHAVFRLVSDALNPQAVLVMQVLTMHRNAPEQRLTIKLLASCGVEAGMADMAEHL